MRAGTTLRETTNWPIENKPTTPANQPVQRLRTRDTAMLTRTPAQRRRTAARRRRAARHRPPGDVRVPIRDGDVVVNGIGHPDRHGEPVGQVAIQTADPATANAVATAGSAEPGEARSSIAPTRQVRPGCRRRRRRTSSSRTPTRPRGWSAMSRTARSGLAVQIEDRSGYSAATVAQQKPSTRAAPTPSNARGSIRSPSNPRARPAGAGTALALHWRCALPLIEVARSRRCARGAAPSTFAAQVRIKEET